jgi:Trk-type K+ transport system membrane component
MDNNSFIIIILCVFLIILSIVKYYLHMQTLQIIAKNTTPQQFNEYLEFRFLIGIIALIIIVFFIFRNKT